MPYCTIEFIKTTPTLCRSVRITVQTMKTKCPGFSRRFVVARSNHCCLESRALLKRAAQPVDREGGVKGYGGVGTDGSPKNSMTRRGSYLCRLAFSLTPGALMQASPHPVRSPISNREKSKLLSLLHLRIHIISVKRVSICSRLYHVHIYKQLPSLFILNLSRSGSRPWPTRAVYSCAPFQSMF